MISFPQNASAPVNGTEHGRSAKGKAPRGEQSLPIEGKVAEAGQNAPAASGG